MANENGGANFMVGFFMGALVGAMGALLLTPKSGRELRDSIAEEGKRLRERVEGGVDEARQRGEEFYGKSREAYTEAAEGVKKAARTFAKS